jgi:hypothetical protein
MARNRTKFVIEKSNRPLKISSPIIGKTSNCSRAPFALGNVITVECFDDRSTTDKSSCLKGSMFKLNNLNSLG